eukprot:2735395-Rhodomonas_salina.2
MLLRFNTTAPARRTHESAFANESCAPKGFASVASERCEGTNRPPLGTHAAEGWLPVPFPLAVVASWPVRLIVAAGTLASHIDVAARADVRPDQRAPDLIGCGRRTPWPVSIARGLVIARGLPMLHDWVEGDRADRKFGCLLEFHRWVMWELLGRVPFQTQRPRCRRSFSDT